MFGQGGFNSGGGIGERITDNIIQDIVPGGLNSKY